MCGCHGLVDIIVKCCILSLNLHHIYRQWLVSELGEEFIVDETQDGATPIHIAAGKHPQFWLASLNVSLLPMGYPDILEWFFKCKEGKSYVNLLDSNKRTPCHDAAEYGYDIITQCTL